MVAGLVGRDHEALVLDRARPHEHLPVVARGGQRERRGDRQHVGAAQREDPVQLREAHVEADAHAERGAGLQPGDDDLVTGVLGRRLRVERPVDLDVEQVDLAIHRLHRPVATDEDAGVGSLLATRDPLEDRPRQQVDPELGGGGPRPADRGAVERLGAGVHLLPGAEDRPLLRQDDELRTERRRAANEPVGVLQVTIHVVGGVELNGGCAHAGTSRLTSQSVYPSANRR